MMKKGSFTLLATLSTLSTSSNFPYPQTTLLLSYFRPFISLPIDLLNSTTFSSFLHPFRYFCIHIYIYTFFFQNSNEYKRFVVYINQSKCWLNRMFKFLNFNENVLILDINLKYENDLTNSNIIENLKPIQSHF